MLILGLSSVSPTASVALSEDGVLKASFMLDAGNTHSETLLPMVAECLKLVNKSVEDIDMFAAAYGPGSFTGVRIGAALIKGLSFPYNVPVVGVSSLEAMAFEMKTLEGIICPVMNARRNQLYTAVFRASDNSLSRITEDSVMMIDELYELLSEMDEKIYFTGDGYGLVSEKIKLASVMETSDVMLHPGAAGVIEAAVNKYRKADDETRMTFTSENFHPVYLRAPQAERERLERLSKECL